MEVRPVLFAGKEFFHLDSVACLLPAAAGLLMLVVAFFWAFGANQEEKVRPRLRFVALAAVVAVATGFVSSLWYSHSEAVADRRDTYVVRTLGKSDVTFEDFQDNDTERVRVSREVNGKKCSATYDVVMGDYGGKWPLRANSGRFPSKDCGLDRVDSSNGLRGHRGSEQSLALNRIFIDPYASKKWAS